MNISFIEQYCSSLQEKIDNLEKELSLLPAGKLVHSSTKNQTKFYQSINGQKNYINIDNKILPQQLAQRQYYTFLIQQYEQEKADLEKYLSHLKKASINNPLSSPILSKLLSDFSLSDNVKKWLSEPYHKNTKYPEKLIYKASSGNYVRSKSEIIIDSLLTQYHIPFRYECELIIDSQIFYPDFTIMHPGTGEIFYWEHLGMMDQDGYFNHAMNKLHTYIASDMIPTHNLILTYETSKRPLDISYIEQLIQFYFLQQ